ncbi:hypothetical protein BDV29DRAFT_151309 [Aspergillus leporis]|uniref:Uncharacterized protein n=1 Tax=Aspergillus leporis TaxID=41062 RepID=A0A5N5WVX4_9EURO|nr:hypothetical protein BDV29DRAFT_151309 [Aspergillus leporis]
MSLTTGNSPILDPIRTKCVSEATGLALHQAEKRKLKGKRSGPVRHEVHQFWICNLPMEVLYMIFDVLGFLPSSSRMKKWPTRPLIGSGCA